MTKPDPDTAQNHSELICGPITGNGQVRRSGSEPPAELLALLGKPLDDLTYTELLRMFALIWKEFLLYQRSGGSPALAAE